MRALHSVVRVKPEKNTLQFMALAVERNRTRRVRAPHSG